jgi:hypothetical protein
MTNGGRHRALRTRMARSNPRRAQYQREVTGCGAPSGKAKTPPGRSARYTPANSAGRSAGRKCPSAPKLTARSKAPVKGTARTSARTHWASGCARRACASMPALKSTPVSRPWQTDVRTRMPRRYRNTRPVPGRTGQAGVGCGKACGRISGRAGRSRLRPRTAPASPVHALTGPEVRTSPQGTFRAASVAGSGRVGEGAPLPAPLAFLGCCRSDVSGSVSAEG